MVTELQDLVAMVTNAEALLGGGPTFPMCCSSLCACGIAVSVKVEGHITVTVNKTSK